MVRLRRSTFDCSYGEPRSGPPWAISVPRLDQLRFVLQSQQRPIVVLTGSKVDTIARASQCVFLLRELCHNVIREMTLMSEASAHARVHIFQLLRQIVVTYIFTYTRALTGIHKYTRAYTLESTRTGTHCYTYARARKVCYGYRP